MLRTRCRGGLRRLSQMQQHGGKLLSRDWQQKRYATALDVAMLACAYLVAHSNSYLKLVNL